MTKPPDDKNGGLATSPTDSPSTSSSEESERERTFIGATGPVIVSNNETGTSRSGRRASRLPLGTQPLQLIQRKNIGGSIATSLNQPLLVAWSLPSTSSGAADPDSVIYLPLSVYFSRCLVCGQDMAVGGTSAPRQPTRCAGPESASQVSLLSGSEAEALPDYVMNWRRRHCYGYWQSVCERRSREPQANTPSEPNASAENRGQVSLETTANDPSLPRVVRVFDSVHPARYDYAFLVFTLLFFPYAWSLILLLYATGWFLFESFFWECCGTFMPHSKGCEQIVALDSDHVVCVRVYESRRLLCRATDRTELRT